jgi:hypothetical protein
MPNLPGPVPPRTQFRVVIAVLFMIAVPAALTLHTAKVLPSQAASAANPSPYGYTVSLLLFLFPILTISLWFVPQDGVKISKKSFLRTIGVLFPLGVILDFFFAHSFLTFPNQKAVSGLKGPAWTGGLPLGSVPIEEYIFYFTGFVAVLLLYIWLDEYWLAAYSVPSESGERSDFDRLLRFHPESLLLAVGLIAAAAGYKHYVLHEPGFPGYFTFLALAALVPSAALFPQALPVINWRAFSLTLFIILLTSLLWEATLAKPYGWWGYQPSRMIGIYITAWDDLPIEAVCVWIAVTYETAIVYEIIRRWQSSGKRARHAFLGVRGDNPASGHLPPTRTI